MTDECPDCGASFGSPGELVRHMQAAHAGGDARASLEMNPESERPGLVCGLCGARFRAPAELARHNATPHRAARPARAPASSA